MDLRYSLAPFGAISVILIGLVVGKSVRNDLAYDRIEIASGPEYNASDLTHRRYSDWTRWSKCSHHDCLQKRFRTCLHTLDSECPHGPLQVQTRRCKKCPSKHKSGRSPLRQSGIDDLFGFANPFEDFFFSSWSRWSACSQKECIQYRFKYCRFAPLCGEQTLVQQRLCRGREAMICAGNHDEHSEEGERLQPATTTTENYRGNDMASSDDDLIPPSFNSPTCGFSQLSIPSSGSGVMPKIFGGRASKPGSWPWMVSLLNPYMDNYCAGTLISNWVLTAAHCVRRRMYVKLGEHNVFKEDTNEQLVQPTKLIIHRHFNTETIENDIAMIKLPSSFKYSESVHPVCIPDPSDETQILLNSTTCVVLGWGKRKPHSRFGSDVLHEAEIEIVSHARCRAAYAGEHPITARMLCAGSGKSSRSDTCEGDSGGPLLCRLGGEDQPWKIFGITSFGDSCGKKDKFGVYTRTSLFLDWINNVVNSE